MNVLTRLLLALALVVSGLGIVLTQQNLWMLTGGLTACCLSSLLTRSTREPVAGTPVRDEPAVRTDPFLMPAILGVVLLGMGIWLLQREFGTHDLKSLSGNAGGSVMADSKVVASDTTLIAGVVTVVGLLAAGGLPPFHSGLGTPVRGTASLLVRIFAPRIAASVLLVRIVAHQLVAIDARVEPALLGLACAGLAVVGLQTLARTADLATLAGLGSSAYVAAACVAVWERRAVVESIAPPPSPDAATILWLCIVADLCSCLVAAQGRAGPARFPRLPLLLGQLALTSLPPFPTFWARLWLVHAMLFTHHKESETGVPEVHHGFLILSLLLLWGLWCGVAATGRSLILPDQSRAPADPAGARRGFLAGASCALLVALALYPRPLVNLAHRLADLIG